MRKNFLILMLMALLPLASWAVDDISDKVEVAVGDVVYGTSTAPAIRVTMNGSEISNAYWDIDGYFTTNDGTGEAVTLATLPAGETRYVKIKFKGVYAGAAYGAFDVAKAKITVAIKTDADFTKVYKSTAANPAITVASDVTAKLNGTDITTLSDYLTIDETELNKYTFVGENVSSDGYPITFTGIELVDDDNYEFSVDARTMKITPATISTTGYSFVMVEDSYPTGGFTYTAAEQRPSYQIAWDHDSDSDTPVIALNEGTDFDVVFNDGTEDVDSPVNAATYTVKVNGKGNFGGTNVAVTAFGFVINKAPLTVMAIAQSKVYDGVALDASTAKFNVSGRVGDDATKTVSGLSANGSLAATAGTYTVYTSTTSAQIGTVALTKNYDVTTPTVEWTISRRPVTVTVTDVEMSKGDDFPTLSSITTPITVELYDATESEEATGAINATELGKIAGSYTIEYANAAGEPLKGVTAGATGNIKIQDYANAIKLKAGSLDAVVANYDIVEVKGTLKVSGADFTIMPVVNDVEYSDTYTIGYYASGATIDESKLVFVIGETEYPYAAQIANLPTARGNYTVSIKEGTAVGTGNYASGTATLQTTSYSITKKQLTLTVKDQTVNTNDPATVLDVLTADGKGINEEISDEVTLTYSFIAATVDIDDDGKIVGYKSGKGATDDAITVALADTEANENFEIKTVTAGKLTFATSLTADLAKATAENTIAVAAANGGNYDVTITGRKLTAGKWNTLVLPFEVTTFQFCEAIGGYAVFNTLKSASAASNSVKFELQLEKIPANTPFLVKPQAAVDFDEVDASDNKINKFTGVTFEAYTGDQPTATVGDADFIGTYEDVTIEGADGVSVMQAGSFVDFGSGNSATLPFTAAYLKLNGGSPAPVITVEEIDGSVTAISGITADGVAIEKDGWYNLNGVQLQGAPAQKGVYIRNGKKIVIK